MNIMSMSVWGTWICIALGFLVDPTFFLIGAGLFLMAATIWTVEAVKSKAVEWTTIAMVWALPIVMFTFLGFAFMYMPAIERKAISDKAIRN